MEPQIAVDLNIVVLLTLGILCIISLQLAIYLDQRKLLKKKDQPAEPRQSVVLTKSGRVMVQKPKRSVIYNDDEKIYQKEIDERNNNGSRGT